MSDIFDEVEENVKADRLHKLWQMAWPFILGGSVAIIAMVGTKSFLDDRAKKSLEANGQAFEMGLKSLEVQDLEGARLHFAKVLDQDTGFADLAAQYLAQAELQLAGDLDGAANALKASASREGSLANLAKLKAAYFLADTKSLAEVEVALGSLVDDDGGFGALAHELLAAKAFEEGDLARSRSEYQALTLRLNAPEGVLQRANDALAVIPVTKAEKDSKEDVDLTLDDESAVEKTDEESENSGDQKDPA